MAPGDIYGFIGPNGAGKTTTLRMLLGLIRPDRGEVRLFGKPSSVSSRTAIGGIVEEPRFYPYLSGLDNLRVFAAYSGDIPEEKLRSELERVGLADRAGDRVGTYSLGMKQRLGIAQALIGSPKLLILDEPTNGLDPVGMREVRDLLLHLRDNEGIAVLVSSHLLGELSLVCNRVGIIQEGRKVAEGPTQDLVREGESLEDAFLRLTGRLPAPPAEPAAVTEEAP